MNTPADRAANLFVSVADDIKERATRRTLFLAGMSFIPALTVPFFVEPDAFLEYWYFVAGGLVLGLWIFVGHWVSERNRKTARARRNLVNDIGVFFREESRNGRLLVVGDRGIFATGTSYDPCFAVFGIDLYFVELTICPGPDGAVDVNPRWETDAPGQNTEMGSERGDMGVFTFDESTYERLEAAVRAYGALDPYRELRIVRLQRDGSRERTYTSRPQGPAGLLELLS